MREVRDKVAVVTGAASGIGRAMAECFAGAGMKLVLADVEEEALTCARTELAAAGARVVAQRVDVANAAELVLDAIRAERFYVLPHPGTKVMAETRFHEILAERNPTPPAFPA